jgi:xylulokinase
MAGGVDNACMALGAKGIENGRAYLSLGSSSWVAVVGDRPLTDFERRPFIFAHCVDGLYASATSIFAGGSCLRWARDTLCPDLKALEAQGKIADAYQSIDALAAASSLGANGLFFNPSLAGGSMIEHSQHIAAGFVGLRLDHSRADMLRAVLEGVVYNLYYAYTVLEALNGPLEQILLSGGGSKSAFWRQMFADVFKIPIQKTNVDQDAASLGAAALALKGLGYWADYRPIDRLHQTQSVAQPNEKDSALYHKQYALWRVAAKMLSDFGDALHTARQ